MARRRRQSLASGLLKSRSPAARRMEAPLYNRRKGAARLMFGTPAARRPYLFNDLL